KDNVIPVALKYTCPDCFLQCLDYLPTRRSSDLISASATCESGARSPEQPRLPYSCTTGVMPALSSPASASAVAGSTPVPPDARRSEEHTSELQSRENLVCRLLHEKKNTKIVLSR